MAIKCSCGKELVVNVLGFEIIGSTHDTIDVDAEVEPCIDCMSAHQDDGYNSGYANGLETGHQEAEADVEELVKNKMQELGYDKAFEED